MFLSSYKFKKNGKPQGILLVVFLIFLCSCGNNMKDLPKPDLKDLENDRAENVSFIFSKNGKTVATIKGKEFIKNDQFKPPYVDLKKDIQADFYNDSLKIDSKLTANFGRYYPETGNIIVRDSVVVINKQGEKLQTEELIWNQKIERFYTDKFVKITLNGEVTYGEGLEANQDFTYIKIKNQRGSIPVNKGDLPLQ